MEKAQRLQEFCRSEGLVSTLVHVLHSLSGVGEVPVWVLWPSGSFSVFSDTGLSPLPPHTKGESGVNRALLCAPGLPTWGPLAGEANARMPQAPLSSQQPADTTQHTA